ncbi:MAG: DUF4956 domain-containing protein [Lachnospiraceae bacterium]|nr:DUF4956 domain-containing protein [Lachnospiraceae bacterium]
MLESILAGANLNLWKVCICILVAALLGLALSFVYMKTERRYSKAFMTSLVVLPAAVCAIIALVNGNLGTGIAILGSFALVRFRSQPGNGKEIAVIFIAMGIGLAAATGYLLFTVIFAAFMCLLLFVLSKTGFGGKYEAEKSLKVTIPEDLDYQTAFEDVFERYMENVTLDNVRTTNLGSMYELRYSFTLKKDKSEKEMIDELRIRNGNLPIVCGLRRLPESEL